MARQSGPIYLTGTIDSITFYKMGGQYLARKKSSLNRKQFHKDPRFARSRKSALAFGDASKLASAIYWKLPKEQRGKGVVNQLTGQVGRLLKEGKTMEDIIKHYQQHNQHPSTQASIQSQSNEATHKQESISAWKVTPTGKLIGTSLEPTLSINLVTSFVNATRLNSYLVPMRE